MDGADADAALDAARRGDVEGFAALYRLHQAPLLRYLRLLAHADAEDVVSETWVSVVKDLRSFSGDSRAFRSWLFTVARHRWADEQRRRQRRPAAPVPDVPETGVTPDAADLALTHESTRAALALIATLPPAQAEAVYLRAVAGLDVSAVAQITDRTPGAVRVLVHRGLRTLAERLEGDRAAGEV